MNISDLIPSNKTIKINGIDVEYHGLSISGISYLLEHYRQELSNIAAMFFSDDKELDYFDLIKQSPDVVFSIIAIGSDCVGQENDISKLQVLDQVSLLSGILKATFYDKKKLLALMSDIKSLLSELGENSKENQ